MIAFQQTRAWDRWSIPFTAACSAFAYGFTLAQTAAAYFPGIGLTWWLYLLLMAAAGIGVTLPLRREGEGANVGRLMIGFMLLLAPSVLGSLAAVVRGGWTIDELLLRGALPGGILLGAFVMASSLGDACVLLVPLGEAAVQAEVEARRSQEGFRQLLAVSFKGWIILALIGSGLVDAMFRLSGLTFPRWGIALGAAIGAAATLTALHLAHVRLQRWLHAAEGDDQVLLMEGGLRQVVLPFALGVALVAAALPANLSPLARHGVGGFFQRLTEWAAPLFVPGSRPGRTGGGGFMDRLTEALLSPFTEGTGSTEAVAGLSAVLAYVMTVAVLVAVAYALWRFVRLMQLRRPEDEGGARYKEGSLLLELIRWLWDHLRGLFRTIASWAEGQAASGEARKKKARRRRGREGQDDFNLGPALRIRALFARWLRQMAGLGYPRQRDETPYEYARRVTRLRPDAETELQRTADIYVKARYSPEQEHSVLERAYKALRGAVSDALQAIRRKSADPR